ncbi:MAG: LacI family DNA-binding transcriptional regulator [Burkholderiales bacterium]|nr:LacI family DNA-binding transcriptional regulator [Anaerolineae bacterium]
MATIKEVADHAGVSVATVSRVINKTGYVSLDLQERVVEAMKTLHYRPSALARGLRRQETQTVGVLIPQLDQPFFSALAYAIEQTLFASDYRALICSAEESQSKEVAYVEMLLRQRVDGVILVPTSHSTDSVQRLLEQNVPMVLVDRDIPELTINRVLSDNQQGGYEGATHLIELGHERIGVIHTPLSSEAMAQRVRGVREALDESGIAYNGALFIAGTSHQFEAGYTAAMELLRQTPRPTAIFALTDVMAMGAMRAAAELGLSLPDDLSVMGFDGTPLSEYSIPALTTVAQPTYQMGETAATLMLRQMQEEEASVESVMLETTLIVRHSTAPPSGTA